MADYRSAVFFLRAALTAERNASDRRRQAHKHKHAQQRVETHTGIDIESMLPRAGTFIHPLEVAFAANIYTHTRSKVPTLTHK